MVRISSSAMCNRRRTNRCCHHHNCKTKQVRFNEDDNEYYQDECNYQNNQEGSSTCCESHQQKQQHDNDISAEIISSWYSSRENRRFKQEYATASHNKDINPHCQNEDFHGVRTPQEIFERKEIVTKATREVFVQQYKQRQTYENNKSSSRRNRSRKSCVIVCNKVIAQKYKEHSSPRLQIAQESAAKLAQSLLPKQQQEECDCTNNNKKKKSLFVDKSLLILKSTMSQMFTCLSRRHAKVSPL